MRATMTTTATEENETEATAMVTPLPDEIRHEHESSERGTNSQENDNSNDEGAAYFGTSQDGGRFEETSMMHLPEISSERQRSSGAYSFVNNSGVLQPAPVESLISEVHSSFNNSTSDGAAAAAPTIEATAASASPATAHVQAYDNETDAVIVSTVHGHSDHSATVVSAERISNEYDAATATVVETVDECSDDALIRKMLQEDLIVSGRSTDELQDFIRTASLENVVNRMNQGDEEEKTEVVEPDSALAWALHEHELSMSNLATTVESGHSSVAAMPAEEATVVRITDHDVHPAEMASSDARAELIGEDYSLGYAMSPDTRIDAPSPAAAVASIEATDNETVTEATVLDSKPAAVVNPWSEETSATVMETKPPADETWSRADDQAGEVTVDAIVEEEATVVDITEDVHPAEFEATNDVEATFIGRDYTSTVAVAEEQNVARGVMARDEAVVVGITEDVHPSNLEGSEAHATLVGSGERRSVSYSSPPSQRPRTAARAVSDQPRNSITSPVDHDTSGSFHRGIAALDELEQDNSTWMHRPSSFGAGDQVVMPPPTSKGEAPMAAAEVMDQDMESDTCSDVPPLPSRATVSASGRDPSRASSTRTEESERSSGTTSSGRRAAAASLQLLSTAAVRGTSSMMRSTGSLMDVLFGESRQAQHGFDLDAAAGSILPRTLLPWSVFPKPNGTWVATVNTNQKALDSKNIREASKALRAFSCATQEQAEALARSWAPPRMLSFSDNPVCFICESKFALLRRACHCRNCGVCVCSNCIVQWPSKMLPETYNIKKESLMNICKSCDWLCSALRLALLNGQFDQAVAVHATGNVNLVTPFANIKGELFYPVHCAVIGGNLSLLRWLCDEHCCPLRSLRVGGRRSMRGSYTPILTSRGRSLLGIAMENRDLDIVRYLVADKNMSLVEEKGLSMETTIQTLEAALHRLPSNPDGTIPHPSTETPRTNAANFTPTQIPSEDMSPTSGSSVSFVVPAQPQETSPTSMSTNAQSPEAARARRDDSSSGSVEDACIICFANTIDCVVTPCGHQICCMQCSTHITRCPVCSVDCSFIRVFKP